MRRLLLCTGLLIVLFVGVGILFRNHHIEQDISADSMPVASRPSVTPHINTPEISLARQQSSISLFSTGEETTDPWASRTPAARRVRRIFPDPEWMTPEPVLSVGDQIHLDLFDDVQVDGVVSRVTRYSNGAVGVTAQLDREYRGQIYLSYCDGQMRASIEVSGGDDYYVRYKPETESHYVIEVDPANSDYQEGGAPKIPSETVQRVARELPPADEMKLDVPVPVDEAEPKALADPPVGLPDDTTVIDVMVVYTPAALSVEGGTSGINNNIALAMEKANEAHANSDTRVYMNLVYSAEVAYTESGDPGLDLDRLTFTDGANSAMDEVHTWRDTYKADLICLFESNPGTGGLGWTLSSELGRPDYGFCLARVQQTDWTYTAVHEWGHNMGCSHSKTQSSSPGPGVYSYAGGWQWADTASSASIGYCSIMTYENFDGNSGNGDEYEEVPYFSNPNISYTGNSTNPTGDANNGDNARCIRNTRYPISDYRVDDAAVSSFPYSNSFETNFSEWVYYEGDALWERTDGSDPNLVNNAPNIATTNAADGNIYLYIDGYEYSAGGQVAYLRAVFDFSSLETVAMDFSYVAYSYWGVDGSNRLQVSTNSGSLWTDLWSTSGESDNAWRQETVDLTAYAGMTNVQLRFKADLSSTWYKNYFCLDAFSVTGQVAEVSDDIDGDGLPDWWETQYYGGATNAVTNALAANGVNTVMEAYIAGLNPTDAGSFFEGELSTANGFVLDWSAVSGRVYSIWSTTNLMDGFETLETNVVWPNSSWTDTVERTEIFYKIGVSLP